VSDRPRLGISACLLGESVRYDGAHKRDAWLVEVLGPQVEWVPVCPEVEAGLGTPREPMALERQPDGRAALMTLRSRRDLTATMRRYSSNRAAELAAASLDGYVFKADSPSCDPDRGIFAGALTHSLPDLPVTDERRLADPEERSSFVARVFAHHRRESGTAAERPRAGAAQQQEVPVVRVRAGARVADVDRTAVEEPLEVRLHGRPFAVIMRTPGHDRELAAGFLLSERVIRSADDLGAIEYCTTADGPASNIVNVMLAGGAVDALDRLLAGRRNVATTSACGMCGRQTIESLAVDVSPVSGGPVVDAALVVSLPSKLRAAQTVFAETGGLHAAGLFSGAGALVEIAEDVGRHNAVDKVVGRMLMREALPLSEHILCVSGRTSFEILQKALLAGIPIVAAVSAPSSLAVDVADSFGITLIGFVRGDTFNLYTHVDRITS
jgi:FdhD protein